MNYGLKFDEIKPEDYIFGSQQLPEENLQPDLDWTHYLPLAEVQNLNGVETYACVTYTILHCVEIIIKRKYGIQKNYSQRFLAMVSGTKDGGNSPQVVCEFLRKIGVVPEELWAFDNSINTFDKFYSPVPPKLYELAKEFLNEFDFGHEYVNPKDIDEALAHSPLLVSVYAWNPDGSGLYFQPDGTVQNHATTLVRKDPNYRVVFDSYDSFLKKVRLDMLPITAKRFYVNKKVDPIKTAYNSAGFWDKVLQLIKQFSPFHKKLYNKSI